MITCTLENGHKALFRHVTVGALVKNKKNEVLIIKRAKHLTNGGKYAIPGGFLDRDETGEQAAIRELNEETGLAGKVTQLFQIIDNPKRPREDRQNIQFNYIIEYESGEFKDNDEVEEIKWVSEADMPGEEDCAFDHRQFIDRYFDYLRNPFPLPLLNY